MGIRSNAVKTHFGSSPIALTSYLLFMFAIIVPIPLAIAFNILRWISLLIGASILLIVVIAGLVRKKFYRTLIIISLLLLAFWFWGGNFISPASPYMPICDPSGCR